MRRKTPSQSPGRSWRNSRCRGYHGESSRPSSQRQSGVAIRNSQHSALNAPARWLTAVSQQTTRSRHESTAAVSRNGPASSRPGSSATASRPASARACSLPAFDVHAPLLSLPLLFGTDLRSIPADVPYLRPDPALVEKWRRHLDALPGFKVGIAWKGSGKNRTDHLRSVPLETFGPLAEVEGVRLVSLQKGVGDEQARAQAGRLGVAELPGLDEAGPFLDTAAVLSCLHLAVCCDTAVSHLAGALGAECWLALMAVPDWRWLLGRDDSPWYPTLRLFRQPRLGAWDPVLVRVAEALRSED